MARRFDEVKKARDPFCRVRGRLNLATKDEGEIFANEPKYVVYEDGARSNSNELEDIISGLTSFIGNMPVGQERKKSRVLL
jgi:hypothetical protein